VQPSFIDEVKSLVTIFEELGNPFMEQGDDLLVLDTRDVLDKLVGEAAEVLEKGEHQKFF